MSNTREAISVTDDDFNPRANPKNKEPLLRTARRSPLINSYVVQALEHLKNHNFSEYLKVLAQLGVAVGKELNLDISGNRSTHDLKNALIAKKLQLENFNYGSEADEQTKLSEAELKRARLAAELFYSSWTTKKKPSTPGSTLLVDDESESEDEVEATQEVDDRGHSAKQDLNKSTRQEVFLGMLAVHSFLENYNLDETVTFENLNLAGDSLKKHDDEINDALVNHETTRQRLVRYFDFISTAFTSVAFGGLETGVAVFLGGLALFTNPVGWTLLGIIGTSLLIGGFATYINYKALKGDVRSVFKAILGRDKLFQGFLQYRDENGKTQRFNAGRIIALAAFSLLFAIPTGIGIGALGYTSAISIPVVLAAFGITASAAIFPPIGLTFAVFVTLTMAAFQIASFANLLSQHNGNVFSFVKKPFAEMFNIIDKRFDPETRRGMNLFVKGLSLGLTGLVSIAAVAGLAVAAMAGANSLTALVSQVTGASLKVSAGIGLAVGGVASFGARLFSTIAKAGAACVSVLKATVAKKDVRDAQTVDKFGVIAAVTDVIAEGIFYFVSIIKPPAQSPIIPTPTSTTYATGAVSCTTARTLTFGITGVIKEASTTNPQAQARRLNNVVERAKQAKRSAVTVDEQQNSKVTKNDVRSHFAFFTRRNMNNVAPTRELSVRRPSRQN